MIKGTCHCGAVSFEVTSTPKFAVSCNCSICRRLATLWVHAPPATVTLNAPDNATVPYVWGDKSLAFHTCRTCGCTTHWVGLTGERMAVNIRLAAPEAIKDLPIRHFDGADTWAFLD